MSDEALAEPAVHRDLAPSRQRDERADARRRAIRELGLADAVQTPPFQALLAAVRRVLAIPDGAIVVCAVEPGSAAHPRPPHRVLCDRVMRSGAPRVIPDVAVDPEFGHLASTGEGTLPLGSFVGLPLMTADGIVVGVVCGFDTTARPPAEASQVAMLGNLAGSAMRCLELQASRAEYLRREAELRRRRSILEAVLQNVEQGITVYDGDMRLVTWNHATTEILELPEGFLHRGRPFRDVCATLAQTGYYGPGDPGTQAHDHLERVQRFLAASGAEIQQAHEIEHVRGRRLLIRTHLLRDGFLRTYRDVTTERRRQEELFQEAAHYETLARLATIANQATGLDAAIGEMLAFVAEAQGHGLAHAYRLEGERLVSLGLACDRPAPGAKPVLRRVTIAEPTPLARAALHGRPIAVDLDARPHVGSFGAACRIQGIEAGLAMQIRVLAETFVFEFYSESPIAVGDVHAAMLGHIEAQLCCVAAREHAQQQESEFVSTVSHELRTPLTTIGGMVELLGSGLFGKFGEPIRSMLDEAGAQSRTLGALIERTLATHDLRERMPATGVQVAPCPRDERGDLHVELVG